MGGHGGLNILPQKKWNVYNFDNREKVRKDEEAAAKEEQIKQDQSRKRDAEVRIEQLRSARGLEPSTLSASSSVANSTAVNAVSTKPHINLFEGMKDCPEFGKKDGELRREWKRTKREEEKRPKVVAPEDEVYRMGYGLVGKNVKVPWYMAKKVGVDEETVEVKEEEEGRSEVMKSGKKTVEELREERFNREKREKERERKLVSGGSDGRRGEMERDRYNPTLVSEGSDRRRRDRGGDVPNFRRFSRH